MHIRSFDGRPGRTKPACTIRVLAWMLALPMGSGWAAADLTPDRVYLQAGTGHGTSTLVGGANWDLPWRGSTALGSASAYVEASVGRWSSRAAGSSTSPLWVSQFGVTPVICYQPAHWESGWFVETGIGVNLVSPVYSNGDRRFSTAFNFGDHLAIGRRIGAELRQEVSLRIQHFSNGGIKSPNPGENFIQIRYSIPLD